MLYKNFIPSMRHSDSRHSDEGRRRKVKIIIYSKSQVGLGFCFPISHKLPR